MNKSIICLLLAAAMTATAWAQITPAPVSVTKSNGVPNTTTEISCEIGKSTFAKKTASLPANYQEEAYRLTVTPNGYTIEANTEAGAFNARQTLKQMDFCGQVFDYARFPYRGLMLDISRHFRDKDFIIKQMEAMATLKLNVLHLHLTDDAGWRIQIDKYPLLTQQAAWRKGASWKEWGAGGQQYAKMGEPDASGGYLTKADVREIVAAAEKLHITVIPEIELPGHSREVIRAYPELGCFDTSGEFCPSKEGTYTFLKNVLNEVMDLFPSQYIHIGGDETTMDDWVRCPYCHDLYDQEGMTHVEQLYAFMMRRIENILLSRGRRLVGWDDILDGGITPTATVMSWRGTDGGIEAMNMGHSAIMAPEKFCYFNHAQDNPLREPEAQGDYLPLEKVYKFEPFDNVPPAVLNRLLGVEACLWQEYIPTESHTEYMLYPRLAAIAEIGWSRPEGKSWKSFRERVARWSGMLADGTLTGRSYNIFNLGNEYGERMERRTDVKHLAKGCAVTYNGMSWSKKYPAYGKISLTDGRRGGWGYADGRWQGFQSDIDVTIDLGEKKAIHYVGATFLCQPGPDIFLPREVVISVSNDNAEFTRMAVLPDESGTPSQSYVLFGAPMDCEARYVRFQAAQYQEWLFLDEIIVN